MSEQKISYMQELDLWTEANIIAPLHDSSDSPQEFEAAVEQVKKLIREKVLQSYRNGQAAGPAKSRSGFKPRAK